MMVKLLMPTVNSSDNADIHAMIKTHAPGVHFVDVLTPIRHLFTVISFTVLLLLLASCGGGGGASSDGGFSRPSDRIDKVALSAQNLSLPTNLNNEPPSLARPYTTAVTVRVELTDGRPIADGTSVQLQATGVSAGGISTLDDPATDENEFFSLRGTTSVQTSGGRAQFFVTSFSTPGVITITASVTDPVSNRVVTGSIQIQVTGEGNARPATSLAFTGAYVGAVLANQVFFNEQENPVSDGSYSRVISVVATDPNGNPVNPNTQINFFLIDSPITGFPNNGAGSFFIAGSNGDPIEGGQLFTAINGNFRTLGARALDRLVLDGRQRTNPLPDNRFHTGIRIIDAVISETTLRIQANTAFNTGLDNGNSVPYVIGRAQHATIRSPAFTNVAGIATTQLTYPVFRVGQTAVLVACTNDHAACAVLNTCNADGASCRPVYLGVSNGTDRILTVSVTELAPNTTTNVELCLKDKNLVPLPATDITYDIGPRGQATVTVAGNSASRGLVVTQVNGCVTVPIASSNQQPGSANITVTFDADDIAEPIPIIILGPGQGRLTGVPRCTFQQNIPSQTSTANCVVDLLLTDDSGSPLANVPIALGDFNAAAPFELRFEPANGLTNAQGQLRAIANLLGAGSFKFEFKTATGDAKYALDVTVEAPPPIGQLSVTTTELPNAEVGVVYAQLLRASGAAPNSQLRWTRIGGQLPPGLTLNPDGTIVGTTATPGQFNFVVRVEDGAGLARGAEAALSIIVVRATGTLEITTAALPDGIPNQSYATVLAARGGNASSVLRWSVTAGQLPPGLALEAASGVISGTPTTNGRFNFVVRVDDTSGFAASAQQALAITIGQPVGNALDITTATLPDAVPNQQYTALLQADGALTGSVLRWAIISGALPPGLSLNASNGVISGIATQVGAYNFVVQVSDTSGLTLSDLATLRIQVGESDAGPPVSSIQLLLSSPQLPSSGTTPITLTAVVRDANNNVVPGARVTFSADNDATVQATRPETNEAGTAEALLSTTGNRDNRTINVSARVGSLVATQTVEVVGTTITVSGPTSVVLGDTVTLSATLVDSEGRGIAGRTLTVTSANGNALSGTTNTDFNGRVTVTVTASQAGRDTITFALGTRTRTDYALEVSADSFVFLRPQPRPAPVTEVPLNTDFEVQVRWLSGGVPRVGGTINFTTTRGTLSANSAVTNNQGIATVRVRANSAGPGVISATTTPGGPSAQVEMLFVATQAATLILQANPSTIGTNPPGTSAERSIIAATVFDPNDNPVKNVTVTFTLSDVTGGSLTAASAVTNAFGEATVTYVAGSVPSAREGVEIRARITIPGQPVIERSVRLTVAQKSLFITLGTGNEIFEPDPTTYRYPYSVLVTDAAGQPVAGAEVTLNIIPTTYNKGFYVFQDPVWVAVFTATCLNEDRNRNGILDIPPDVDENNNGRLDPGNVVTLSQQRATTDTSGFAFFDVRYAQQYANWIDVELEARARVAGTEATEIKFFKLPGIATDFNKPDVTPPGQPSPFGTSESCATEGATRLTVTTETLPFAELNVAYQAQLQVSGASASSTVRWFIASGELPSGITLNSETGVLSGLPTRRGTFQFVVRADDLTGGLASGTATLTLTILDTGVPPDPGNPARLGLGTDRVAVDANNANFANITATALDANNAPLRGVTVSFSASGGVISASSVITDASGNATIQFRAGTVDPRNQVVTISARVGTLISQIPIQITGITLEMTSGNTSLPVDGSQVSTVTMSVLNGSAPVFNTPVCLTLNRITNGNLSLSSATGQPLTQPCPVPEVGGVFAGNTDVTGRVSVQVTGSSVGRVVLIATGAGATGQVEFSVSAVGNVFRIVDPPSDPIPVRSIGERHTITVNAPGASRVSFSTSLGTWEGTGGSTLIEVPVTGNQAVASLTSTIAGTANVLVRDVNDATRNDSIQVAFSAALANAEKLLLTASSRVLPISRGTVRFTSTLFARLLTADDQPVANATVTFALLDSTGGGEFISPPVALTDTSGRAQATFTSGSQASSQAGLRIRARVDRPGLPALETIFPIVITDEAGSVVIGVSTTVASIDDDTNYRLPMSVLVTDINGNAIGNAPVNLSAWPIRYYTGIRNFIPGNNIPIGQAIVTDVFENEDENENGILDVGEDRDGNGRITPPNAAAGALPLQVTTDVNGVANFGLTYSKDYANWVVIRVRASVRVGGTEIVSERQVGLPVSTADFGRQPPILGDSPFNQDCPFTATAEPPFVQVQRGGSSTSRLRLFRDFGSLSIVDRRVTALVDDRVLFGTTLSRLGVSASVGFTDSAGEFLSTIFADLRTSLGGTAIIYYYVSCAPVTMQAVVREEVP